MAIIFETERLLLRHFILDELEELFALYSEPDIRKYFATLIYSISRQV